MFSKKFPNFWQYLFIAKNLPFFKHQLWLLILTKFIKLNTKTLESTAQICCYMSEYDLLLEELL